MRAEPVVQTEAIIGATSVMLARSEDRHPLQQHFEDAATTSGRFVDIAAADGSDVSVFVSPHTNASFRSRRVMPGEVEATSMVLPTEGNWDLL
ncbi:hypothetical protein M0722_13820 [Microbacterium sp. KSW4-16]|uniref:hypothetical protein n=1 Tax=Microbacterium aurugineum TaxID=2851642 RepID=UPI0020BF4372|nr:hypothetical protein [Microbacterium aurugineum]MCK8468273.1 hypothetical protein [Microbacterium aurugineum]